MVPDVPTIDNGQDRYPITMRPISLSHRRREPGGGFSWGSRDHVGPGTRPTLEWMFFLDLCKGLLKKVQPRVALFCHRLFY